MVVTATEFKANFGKYLELIAKEDIFITRNGKTVAKVVNPQNSAVDGAAEILGIGKSELIDIYDKLGYSYLDMTMDELDLELENFRQLKKRETVEW